MALFDFLRKKTSLKNSSKQLNNDNSGAPKYIISGTGRDYEELDNYDIALKIWLPEDIDTAMSQMCSYTNTTKSDLIRQTIFTYLYGRYDLMGLIERGDNRFALSSPPLFSRAAVAKNSDDTDGPTNRTPELGKNTEDVKVWIASRMKSDLQTLADNTELSLSHFIREVLISNLLGHSYLSARPSLEVMRIEIDESL